MPTNMKTPWHAHYMGATADIQGGDNEIVCQIISSDRTVIGGTVRRVNAHDDLVAELQKCLKAFGDYSNMKPDGKLGKSVRAALAAAGKETT